MTENLSPPRWFPDLNIVRLMNEFERALLAEEADETPQFGKASPNGDVEESEQEK